MTYLRDMSTKSISTMCPTIIAESSMSFKTSSSLHVAVKPSLAAAKSARGYRDLEILRVRLADYFILARMIFWGLCWVEACYCILHHRL
jgi:hypothetical protein